ncbi:MAG TPA: trehalase family glycosidase [Alloacidobacterium sp.]|nr:trehalase family glycosidase [Alloacidobacterium sp.]
MSLEAYFRLCVGCQYISAAKRCIAAIAIATLSCTILAAQTAPVAPPSAPPSTSIDQYIHRAWDTLARSMTDCNSLIDPKLKTAPVLYLPKELPEPPQVATLHAQCGVRIERLPRRITHIGDIDPRSIKVPGLLYLPNKYVVPGGRFNEMYGWDSYFILLGLLKDGHVDLARGMVENFFFEIEHYGSILNANRTYYLTRSQPPFLSSMIRDVYEAQLLEKDSEKSQNDAWLARAYGFAVRDHNLWLSDFHRAGDTGLARYFDLGEGPVPEQEDDSTYYPDIIRWLLAHPNVKTDYLVTGPDQPNDEQKKKLAKTSCDVSVSTVCARAHVDGHWLSADYYRGDRAMRESGYDPSFRFGPFSGWTHHDAPICLNSLLYKYERDLAWMATRLGKTSEAKEWNAQAESRKAAINKYLWNAKEGMYFDYDYMEHKQSTYRYLTTFYPLWAGVADEQQIQGVEKALHWFEQPGGLAMSTYNSGTQWDLPFGWAPPSWIAIAGLEKAGDIKDARRLSEKFSATIKANYDHDHTIREKYDVVSGSSQLDVATGYKTNEVGFGWTNAAYLKMQELLGDTGNKQ